MKILLSLLVVMGAISGASAQTLTMPCICNHLPCPCITERICPRPPIRAPYCPIPFLSEDRLPDSL
jgi:hypothetical protein